MPINRVYDNFDYFDALFENTQQNSVLLIQPDGIIAAINTAFSGNFGYTNPDIIGKKNTILFTEEDQKKGRPEIEISQTLKTGQSNDNNYLVNKNGERIWVSGESILITNEEGQKMILKIIQNIHKQKSSEISVRELNAFNENILESISDIVVVLDEEINIIKANKAYLLLCNDNEEAQKNISWFLNHEGPDKGLYNSLKNVLKSQKGFTKKEAEIETPDRSKKIFEVSCQLLQIADKKNILLVMHDITVYKELQTEREDVIGFISHELRNPLSNLMLSNDLMKDAANSNDISFLKEMLERTEKNVQRMNTIISSLYESSKVHSGYLPLDLSEFNFGEMVNEAIETIRALYPSFQIIREGDDNFYIMADRNRIMQVITNFLSNAIKYSNDEKEIKLIISRDSKSVTVSVKDKGLGISKDYLPYVFERFFRTEKTRNIEGIGLGLYLCRQIIRSHHGTVGAESEENKGSIFYFTIPLTAADSHSL